MSSIPQTLRRLHYGWVIVIVAAFAMVATLPGRTHGLGMITERLLQDERFHLDRVSYGDINSWATILGALFCLPCGWLIDRFGLKLTLTVTMVALTANVFWMTQAEDVTSFSIAIFLTRGFGQSALSVISITMVGKWFPDRLSFPMAVYSLLLSLGFVYAAQLAKPYADADWRVVWNGIGYLLAAGIPFSFLLTRDPTTKELAGIRGENTEQVSVTSKIGFTLWQAMSTQAFWVFGLSISLIALIGSGTSLFNESVLTEQGFPKQAYYNLISFTGTVGLLAKIPIGLIGQRVSLNRMLAFGLFLTAACLALLPLVRTDFGLACYATGMGIGGTITTVLFFTIWGQAFGKAHLGQIQAIGQMMTVFASAGGPPLFARYFEEYGSYAGIFRIFAVIGVVIGVWSCLIHVPSPQDAPRAAAAPLPVPEPT